MSGLEGGGLTGGGIGGSYQPGVYVPLKALFLVKSEIVFHIFRKNAQLASCPSYLYCSAVC